MAEWVWEPFADSIRVCHAGLMSRIARARRFDSTFPFILQISTPSMVVIRWS